MICSGDYSAISAFVGTRSWFEVGLETLSVASCQLDHSLLKTSVRSEKQDKGLDRFYESSRIIGGEGSGKVSLLRITSQVNHELMRAAKYKTKENVVVSVSRHDARWQKKRSSWSTGIMLAVPEQWANIHRHGRSSYI